MRIVCLCGSTRYRQAFLDAQAAETLAGNIVLTPGVYPQTDGTPLTTDDVDRLHTMHLAKIEMADELLVIAPSGRVGESTAHEIAHGEALDKPIRFWDGSTSAAVIDPVEALIESHRAMRLLSHDVPTLDVSADVKALRCALIEEEAAEFRDAVEADDLVEVADAIGDLLYVVYGAALTFGIPAREVFAEVHRSNMTKLNDDGEPDFRGDGKVLKGPNFSPPELLPILLAAGLAVPRALVAAHQPSRRRATPH